MKKKRSIIWSISDEEFIELVKNSRNYTEILYKGFGLRLKGGNNRALKSRIKSLNISIHHFKRTVIFANKRSLEELLIKGSYVKTSSLKKRLFSENILENKCNCCGLLPMWEDKVLSLHLDHKNGDNEDNRIENLRILCPNCHSQTSTYSGKNKRPKNSDNLIKTKSEKLPRKLFSRTDRWKHDWNSIDLEKLYTEIGSLSGVAKYLGNISDNALKKHFKKKNIEWKRHSCQKLP